MLSARPDVCLPSFEQLTPDMLCRAVGADEVALTFDLDGTIIGQHDKRPPDDYLRTFEALGSDERIVAMAAISNAGENRVERAYGIVKQVAEAAGQPVACVTSYEVGSQKPWRPIFRETTAVLGVPREQTLHIGDQGFKDVAGGKWAGYGATALVPPYRVEGEHPITHHLQRPAEAVWRQVIGLPLNTANFTLLESALAKDQLLPEPSAKSYRRGKLASYGAAALMAGAGAAGIAEYDQVAGGIYALFNAGLLGYTGRLMGLREQAERVDEAFEAIFDRYRYDAKNESNIMQ